VYIELSPGEDSRSPSYIEMARNYIEKPAEKARKARGTVFMPALYISRSPGELSGRAESPKMGAGGLLEGCFYI
jgi:hypothetical protein